MTTQHAAGRFAALAALAGTALVGWAAFPTAAAAKTEITYGSYSEPSAPLNKDALVPWLEDVKKRTNGSVTYTFVPGGAVVGTKTTLPGIRDGIVDGGMVVGVYYTTDIPVNALISNLGGLGGDARVDAAASTETILYHCPECIAEWRKWNVQYIASYSTTGYSLLCRTPALTMDDIKGRKIRAPGALGRMAVALGMTPVNITITETYEALQRGQVDCTFGPPGWLTSFNFIDSVKNVTMTERGSTFGGTMLNLRTDTWKKLTPAERKAFVDAAPAALAGYVFGYIRDDDEALASAKSKGVTVSEPPPAMIAAIQKFQDAELDSEIKAATARKIPNAEKISRAFVEMQNKWRAIVKDVGKDRAKYEEALRREIFSKYPLD